MYNFVCMTQIAFRAYFRESFHDTLYNVFIRMRELEQRINNNPISQLYRGKTIDNSFVASIKNVI